MKTMALRVRHHLASGPSRLANVLLDLAFAWRIVRVQWLRKAGRHREADRVLRAVQWEFEDQRRS